jgi:CDGSH-type Zn-finger protein
VCCALFLYHSREHANGQRTSISVGRVRENTEAERILAAMRAAFAICCAAGVASGLQVGLAPVGQRSTVCMSGAINESIDKESPKVVNTLKLSEMKGKKAVMCRCWKSTTFPGCDGSHAKHNEATGDNVGPLIIEKDI